MTIGEALEVFDRCNWFKLGPSKQHVTASLYRSRAELQFIALSRQVTADDLHKADVSTRRKKGESLEAFLIRAATMVEAGHQPTRRERPTLTNGHKCACGASGFDLRYNDKLKQFLCRRCDAMWATAGRNNDIGPAQYMDRDPDKVD